MSRRLSNQDIKKLLFTMDVDDDGTSDASSSDPWDSDEDPEWSMPGDHQNLVRHLDGLAQNEESDNESDVSMFDQKPPLPIESHDNVDIESDVGMSDEAAPLTTEANNDTDMRREAIVREIEV